MPSRSSLTPPHSPNAPVLIADHDDHTRLMLKNWISEIQIPVLVVSTGKEVLFYLRKRPISLAILGIHLPDMKGLDVFREALRNGCTTPVVFVSSNPPVETVVQAMKLGARDFITHPIAKTIFLNKIGTYLNPQTSSSTDLATRIDRYMVSCCTQSSLCVNDICAQFGISRRYVSKLFREHFHTSFRSRLAYHRIQKAKYLLQTSNHQLYTVAEACGFKHPSRLTEAFRKIERITPRQYRLINNDVQSRKLPS